ncbi:hypothetical protein FAM09_22205 [Niastella caeni]|uniref:Uncharacterized protein n=1 Tax=Niastella caeni TaxID=2569763 RepID=A0A4S8HLB4_9BACT|nr:HEPN domain-containing protein [Niastella caeni]THU36100.1 hypothetical protein FAM09_22205 [Niastella caeni]
MKQPAANASKSYSIVISPPDFFTYEPYEDFEKYLLECWVSASKVFSKFEFYYNQDKITIVTDWKKFKPQFKYSIDNADELIITVTGNATLIKSFSEYFVIRFIEMMYITMNLAAPGTFNIFDATLKCIEGESLLVNGFGVSLSSNPFEHFWETCGELNHWPKVSFMPLDKVVDWYKELNITLKAKATTNVERCLFSLINFGKDHAPFSPPSLIWITHSLEALYDTPKEGVLNALRNRLFLFLGEPASHKNEYKKKINALYELRSQFVHGSMEVAREPFFENIDKDVEVYMRYLSDTCDFGIMLLVATLQKIIIEKGKELKFHEQYKVAE